MEFRFCHFDFTILIIHFDFLEILVFFGIFSGFFWDFGFFAIFLGIFVIFLWIFEIFLGIFEIFFFNLVWDGTNLVWGGTNFSVDGTKFFWDFFFLRFFRNLVWHGTNLVWAGTNFNVDGTIFSDFLVFLTFFWFFSIFLLFQNRVEKFKISVTVLYLVRKMEKSGTNFFSKTINFLNVFLVVIVRPGIRDHLWPPSFTANIVVSKVILKKPKKMAKKVIRDTFSLGSAQMPANRKVPPDKEKIGEWNTVEFFSISEGASK